MRNTITVMNAKGGVGKSTLVTSLAETLSTFYRRKILVLDCDAQASVSHMLVPQSELEAHQSEGRTIVEFLIGSVLKEAPSTWRQFVVAGVSDVDDARSIDIVPSDSHLTLFEREVSKGDHEASLRRTVGALLAEARQLYDIVLVDNAPGLSVLTECFLREADFYMAPTKPDHVSTRGLRFLRDFCKRDPDMGFAEFLGVIVNMKDMQSMSDDHVDRWLRRDREHRCFRQAIFRTTPMQAASSMTDRLRSYQAKYPGQTGDHLRELAEELLGRLAAAQTKRS